jgi:hypothetical protein
MGALGQWTVTAMFSEGLSASATLLNCVAGKWLADISDV